MVEKLIAFRIFGHLQAVANLLGRVGGLPATALMVIRERFGNVAARKC